MVLKDLHVDMTGTYTCEVIVFKDTHQGDINTENATLSGFEKPYSSPYNADIHEIVSKKAKMLVVGKVL